MCPSDFTKWAAKQHCLRNNMLNVLKCRERNTYPIQPEKIKSTKADFQGTSFKAPTCNTFNLPGMNAFVIVDSVFIYHNLRQYAHHT